MPNSSPRGQTHKLRSKAWNIKFGAYLSDSKPLKASTSLSLNPQNQPPQIQTQISNLRPLIQTSNSVNQPQSSNFNLKSPISSLSSDCHTKTLNKPWPQNFDPKSHTSNLRALSQTQAETQVTDNKIQALISDPDTQIHQFVTTKLLSPQTQTQKLKLSNLRPQTSDTSLRLPK